MIRCGRSWRRLCGLALIASLSIAAANPATESSHVVEEGETLGGIANRAKVPAAVIAAANGLIEPYDVKVGQTLHIPRQRNHTVRQGETLGGIANRYGVPSRNIAIANGLASANAIQAGQKLIIPAVMRAEIPVSPTRSAPYFRRPHDGDILLGFALRPDGGGHDGLDFAATAGDMVRASSSGTVSFAGADAKRFGRMVVIDHGNGWQSAYGHLARVTVAKGDVVKTGERIGIAGDAGDADRVEVHFEIRHNDKPIDPAPKLPARRGSAR